MSTLTRPEVRVAFAVAGLALATLGVGWSAAPAEDRVVEAVRARLAANAVDPEAAGAALEAQAALQVELREGELRVLSVRRDWAHELFSQRASRFFVRVAWNEAGQGQEGCFLFEPGRLAGGELASGPRSQGECD